MRQLNKQFISILCSIAVIAVLLFGLRSIVLNSPRLFACVWGLFEIGAALYVAGKLVVSLSRWLYFIVDGAVDYCRFRNTVADARRSAESWVTPIF